MRRWLGTLALSLALAALATAGAEAKRLALVIGNAAYRDVPLANPVNDAQDMAARLVALDFEVVLRTDATRADMGTAIAEFLRRLEDGDEAVVFYAGHGVQVRGVNYLMPIDASPRDENDVELQAISLDTVLRGLGAVDPKVSLLMLDACRNNPFERRWRGGSRGLARVEAASGTLISYAAKPGTTAADGRSRNSPYTTAWLAELEKPGMSVEDILKRVHVAVREETRGQQETWQEGQIVGRLVLNVNVTVAAPSPAPQGGDGFDPRRIELTFWESAERQDTAAGYEAYLSQFPSGTFAPLARVRLNSLQADAAPAVRPAPGPAEAAVAMVAPPVPAPPTPETIEQEIGLDRDGRRDVQRWLQALGHDPRGIDGMFGPGSRAAIAAWQASVSQPANGFLTPLQHVLLAERGRTALASVRPVPAPAPAAPPATPAVGVFTKAPAPGERFSDCPNCPEMVWLPTGTFTMGSPGSEEGRDGHEGPQRRVTVGYPVAVARTEITRDQYARFVSATGRGDGAGCNAFDSGDFRWSTSRGWRQPGFGQGGDHPAVCVSWEEARAYAAWLRQQTGQPYRLLSEAEWEYAARGGTRWARWWGDDADVGCGAANTGDLTARQQYSGWTVARCSDGHVYTSPAGTFRANAFGLHDMLGNVWEWVEDCYNPGYGSAPTTGAAWTDSGDCGIRVARGGAWNGRPRDVRSAIRIRDATDARYSHLGFRVARTR